jgi:hypothetical protein
MRVCGVCACEKFGCGDEDELDELSELSGSGRARFQGCVSAVGVERSTVRDVRALQLGDFAFGEPEARLERRLLGMSCCLSRTVFVGGLFPNRTASEVR